MKGEAEVVQHVVAATGIGEDEARRVIDAAFGFVRSTALAGEAVSHPSLGAIRPRQRERNGVTETVFRFAPDPGQAGAGKPKRQADAGSGGKGAGGGKGRGAGGGKGAGRRGGGGPAGAA